MNDFKSRLLKESDELNYRIEKLKEFIVSDNFSSIVETEQAALREQLKHMSAYADVLNGRVSRLCTGNS